MTDTIQQFDSSVDLLKAILWQYNDAVNLQTLLEEKAAWYKANHEDFWEAWRRDVFDLRTCNDFGLTVWAIILQQNLFAVTEGSGEPTWGFEQYHRNFTRGNFGGATGEVHKITADTARILIQIRYFQLTSSGTIPETNRMLKWVFRENYGPALLVDNHNMTQTYVFGFPLSADLRYIFKNFDVLPRPAGVGSNFIVTLIEPFGFEATHANFDHGNFLE
jgi:hypothetical protein